MHHLLSLLIFFPLSLSQALVSPGRFCGVESMDAGTEKPLLSSAQLEPGGRLDGIQQLVPHQVLIAELWELEQVHAGARGGQAVQVVAPIVDAEGWVKLLCACEGSC